jgi:hypothetical protein
VAAVAVPDKKLKRLEQLGRLDSIVPLTVPPLLERRRKDRRRVGGLLRWLYTDSARHLLGR